jgi:hypothetical protein
MATQEAAGLRKIIPNAFREVLLLEQAQHGAERRTPEQQSKIRELTDAVETRLQAADAITGWDQLPAALVLLRDGTVLAIWAVLESRGIDYSDSSLEGAYRELGSLVDNKTLPPPPAGFDRARDLLLDTRHLAFDTLPRAELAARRADVEATLGWLQGLYDSRSVRQIRLSRALRVGVTAIVVAGLAIGLLVWGATKILGSKNLARGKPAQLSSTRAECPPGSGPSGRPASGIDDGSIGSAYDICTNFEANPWVSIDLEKVQPLAKAKVYNRGDCCWGAHDLPVVFEVSQDGKNFEQVARRTDAYTASDPWVVDIGGRLARFVRVRADAPDQRELVLSEIEVFAAK